MNSLYFYFYWNDLSRLTMSDLPPDLYEAYCVIKPLINWENLGISRSILLHPINVEWSTTKIPPIRSSYFLTNSGLIGNMGDKFHQYLLNHSNLELKEYTRSLNFYDRFLLCIKPYFFQVFLEVKPFLIAVANTYVLVVETPFQILLHTFHAVDGGLYRLNTAADKIVESYNWTYYATTRGNMPPTVFHFNSAYGGYKYPDVFDELLKYRVRSSIDGHEFKAARYVNPPADVLCSGINWSIVPIYDTSHYFSRTTVPMDLLKYSNGSKVNTVGLTLNYCVESQNNFQLYCGFYFTPEFPSPRSAKAAIGICFDSSSYTRVSYTREYLPH